MKEKAKGTERAERAKTRTRQHEKVEREQVSKGNAEGAITDCRKMEEKVSKGIAEGAITDRRKMKQRRGSNHGPSKIERKSERKSEQSNLHRETSHGPSKNEATQREQSRTVEN